MALDEYTRSLRRHHLGSSDAAAIVGRDPWRNAFDVWAEKTGRVPDQPATESPVMALGQYLEPAVLTWAEDTLETPLTRHVFRVGGDPSRCANFDAVSFDLPAIIEAKTAGLIARPRYFGEFGDAGTDELPDHILVQVGHQLLVANEQEDWPAIDVALVPVLLVGIGFVLYRVPQNADLCLAIADAEERFWRDHVLADVPPPDVVPSRDTIARYLREPGKSVPVDAGLVAAWRLAQADATAAKKRADAAQQQLLATLGDAELGTCDLGTVTYKSQTRAAYTVEAASYRVARFTAARTTGKD